MDFTRILLLVSGNSPQIITETLYALLTQPTPWVPHQVHLITTSQGRLNAIGQLLSENNPRFKQLLQDYGVEQPITFNSQTIHVITQQGHPLEDLRTPSENEAAADFITQKVREFTAQPNTQLHLSLAGGRKTMGFYAGYALSLFGRQQDTLSHVLVSQPYESSEFYYPAPKPETAFVHLPTGKTLDTHNAQVWLAHIPFVKMRPIVGETIIGTQKSFSETIALANLAHQPIHLKLSPEKGLLECNGIAIKIATSLMPLLTWAAERHIKQQKPIACLVEGDETAARDYGNHLLALAATYNIDLNHQTETLLRKHGFTQKDLQEKVSKLNNILKKALGQPLANRCKLANLHTQLGKGYALPENITLIIE